MADLFEVLVDGVNERDDEVKAVGDEAKAGSHARAILAQAKSGDDLVRLVVEAGVRASAQRLGAQQAMAVRQVRDEGKALERADPRSIRPITDADAATRRTAKLNGNGES